jgi:cellobiose-specific phosphotransferase system component IIC
MSIPIVIIFFLACATIIFVAFVKVADSNDQPTPDKKKEGPHV